MIYGTETWLFFFFSFFFGGGGAKKTGGGWGEILVLCFQLCFGGSTVFIKVTVLG